MPQPLQDNVARRDIAANVRAQMARDRWTQRELADVMGYTRARLARRLSGDVPFTLDELIAIRDVLGCDLSTLTEG